MRRAHPASRRVVAHALRGVALALVLSTSACGEPGPRTELIIDLLAEPAIARQAHDVFVRVTSGHPSDGRLSVAFEGMSDTPPPIRIALTPRDDDASRIVVLDATARDPAGTVLATVRMRSGFVADHIKQQILRFEDACAGISCAEVETCRAGACVDAAVDPASLPDYPADAGTIPERDASIVRADAGP